MPQVISLSDYWQRVPPVALQLRRIASALGISEPRLRPPVQTTHEALREAVVGGLPVQEGRPDDPLLKFLDL